MLMRLIDEIHLDKPFLGIRRIKDALHDLGHTVNQAYSTLDAQNRHTGNLSKTELKQSK